MLEIAAGIILALLVIKFWPVLVVVLVFLLFACVVLAILAALIALGINYPPLGWLPLIGVAISLALGFFEDQPE